MVEKVRRCNTGTTSFPLMEYNYEVHFNSEIEKIEISAQIRYFYLF